MQFDVLTLFPDLIYQYVSGSILGRAQKEGLLKVKAHDFRRFSGNRWGQVDDRPYGGGPGMILRVEPIYECLKAIDALSLRGGARATTKQSPVFQNSLTLKDKGLLRSARNDKTKVVIMDPAGKKFDQRQAEKLAQLDRLVIISGRYEGFDARVYRLADERVSVGDYVLAGGELPALVIIEAVARLIPGVLGNAESLKEETFGLPAANFRLQHTRNIRPQTAGRSQNTSKEYPQYTRPENFMGLKVPKVLLSGDHKKIEEWRRKQSR
ncbi:MAG: tRNA (guanosine(37)-N1)-methyltransferase TrmD [Candidatus Magasanikbacteria bacterium]|nr:tRNA (guanosine(37)-N1)-methyltransferase TrmD [Candidatus Magasanikbacteria bacterium]